MFCDTPKKFGWFSALKASTRNCRVAFLGSTKFLKKPRSTRFWPGSSQNAAARVAERTQRRLGEGSGVEPLVGRAAARVDVAHDVRPVRTERVEDASHVCCED